MTAYLILDLKILDFTTFAEYIEKVPAFIEKHGGCYRVQGAEPEVIEGEWKPERIVVLEFPSGKAAKEFLEDPEFQPLLAVRHRSTRGNLILVEGR